MSYTTFEYKNVSIDNTSLKEGSTINVSCEVSNVGNYDGAEVVQLYVRDVVSSVTTPVKALKAFKKIYLKRGETQKVSLQIAKDDLMIWNKQMKRVLEPGDFEIYIGSSVEDIRLRGCFTL